MQQTMKYKIDIDFFHDYGSKHILTTNAQGDSETFYFHISKYYTPRIVLDALERFNCSAGL